MSKKEDWSFIQHVETNDAWTQLVQNNPGSLIGAHRTTNLRERSSAGQWSVSRFCQMHLCHFSSSCTVVDVFSSTWGACSMIAGHLQTLYFDLAEKRALIFARASCEKARVANKKLSTHVAARCRTLQHVAARCRTLPHGH